jgi:hypothetical protein
VEKPEGDNFEDLGIDDTIIAKWIFKTSGGGRHGLD